MNSLPDWNLTRYPHETVPPLEAVRSADFVLLVGQFTNTAWAEQLAGLLENVIPEGTVLIVAFPPQVAGALEPLLARLGVGYVPASISPVKVVTIHPAFTEYFALFGQSAARFEPDQATEVLGETHAPEGDRVPAAVSVSRGRGAIYAVPFFFAGAEAQFAPMLSAAITAHLADSAAVPPPFLAGLRLPREQDLLDEIDEFGDKAPGAPGGSGVPGTLSLLLGPRGTGTALENLVIEALNVVFRDTAYEAEDRADVGAEDFWIVGPDGDVALAEVKGTNTNVRREDVNQVDSHRDAAEKSQEFPGLLIVNIFRGHDSLEHRESPVPELVLNRAVNSNVLILRTKDLYDLVALKLDGTNAGEQLVGALNAGGGGWLTVVDGSATVRTDGGTP